MIKLIVTDLDGSLVNDEKDIPSDFWEVEAALHKMGIRFAVASGRPLHNIVMEFDAIKDRTYFISDNGSYIVHQDEELLVLPMNKDIINKFVAITRTLTDVYPVLCGKHMAFLEDRNEELLETALTYYQEYEIVDKLEDINEPILKISICDFGNTHTNSYPHFKKYEGQYKVAISGARWLDITEFEADKGNAVRLLQEKLGVSYDETMVFGDYQNDLQLMKAGKYSYAMKNAQPEVIEAANFITEFDNNHNGVVKTIRKMITEIG